jgi:hypothetical protein
VRKVLLNRVQDREEVIRRGFKTPNELINALFLQALRLEKLVFRWRPLGTSLIYVGKKSG